MVLSKIKSSKKAQAAKGFLEKNVPIPAHFYAGKTDEDLMAPKRASRRKSIFFFLPSPANALANPRLSRRLTTGPFPRFFRAEVILPFVLVLNLFLIAAFAGFMTFYSLPGSYLTEISIEPDYDFGASLPAARYEPRPRVRSFR